MAEWNSWAREMGSQWLLVLATWKAAPLFSCARQMEVAVLPASVLIRSSLLRPESRAFASIIPLPYPENAK